MPFKSRAQRAYLFAKQPEVARKFEAHTPEDKKLPQHVKKSNVLKLALGVSGGGIQKSPLSSSVWTNLGKPIARPMTPVTPGSRSPTASPLSGLDSQDFAGLLGKFQGQAIPTLTGIAGKIAADQRGGNEDSSGAERMRGNEPTSGFVEQLAKWAAEMAGGNEQSAGAEHGDGNERRYGAPTKIAVTSNRAVPIPNAETKRIAVKLAELDPRLLAALGIPAVAAAVSGPVGAVGGYAGAPRGYGLEGAGRGWGVGVGTGIGAGLGSVGGAVAGNVLGGGGDSALAKALGILGAAGGGLGGGYLGHRLSRGAAGAPYWTRDELLEQRRRMDEG